MAKTDIELVYLAQAARDDAAFAELVRRHQGKLRAFLMRFTGDHSIVDDIAQMSLIKAHRAIGDFRGGGSFRSWLFAIAYREFLQQRRREVATQRIAERVSETTVNAEVAPAAELSMDLRSALLRLSENERASLLLCDAAGFTHAEAAAALSAPLGSVKSWVARGRDRMRAILSPPEEDQAGETKTTKGQSYA